MIQSTSDREKGVALITVVLMTAIVVGLIALVVTNSMVETVVTTTYKQIKQNEECGHGNLDLAQSVFLTLATRGQDGFDPNKIDINDKDNLRIEIGGGATAVGGNEPLNADDVAINPDFTILPAAGADCQTSVDVDKLYQIRLAGSQQEQSVDGYDIPLSGHTCPDGVVYAITTLANDIQNNTVKPFRSVYYKCP